LVVELELLLTNN